MLRDALRILGGLDGAGYSLLLRILRPPVLYFAFPFTKLLRTVTFVLFFFFAPDGLPDLGVCPDTRSPIVLGIGSDLFSFPVDFASRAARPLGLLAWNAVFAPAGIEFVFSEGGV